jgi:hypothetical protein
VLLPPEEVAPDAVPDVVALPEDVPPVVVVPPEAEALPPLLPRALGPLLVEEVHAAKLQAATRRPR